MVAVAAVAVHAGRASRGGDGNVPAAPWGAPWCRRARGAPSPAVIAGHSPAVIAGHASARQGSTGGQAKAGRQSSRRDSLQLTHVMGKLRCSRCVHITLRQMSVLPSGRSCSGERGDGLKQGKQEQAGASTSREADERAPCPVAGPAKWAIHWAAHRRTRVRQPGRSWGVASGGMPAALAAQARLRGRNEAKSRGGNQHQLGPHHRHRLGPPRQL